MAFKVLLILALTFNILSCSKKETAIYVPSEKNNPYILYEQGLNAFEKNDFFYASKKFSEAEINFDN